MAIPFGMHFLERSSNSELEDNLPIYYDDSLDCSMINSNQGSLPFVKSSLASLSTVIVTRRQQNKPEDDEDDGDMWRSTHSWLTTVTITKTNGEGPQDDDSYEWYLASSRLMTVTVTENRGEGPQDDEGDDGSGSW